MSTRATSEEQAAWENDMRTVQLRGTEIRVSRLGFGCAGLMGRLGSAASARLLDAALDAGITHFDTARMYGYGEAERALAPILAERRNRITVATKVGILPPRRSAFASVVRTAARHAVRIQPRLRTLIRRGAQTSVRHGVFDIPTIRSSFETSLRELGTDRIDVLLLHECSPDDLARPELVDFLEALKQSGRVGEYGIAAATDCTLACLPVLPAGARIVQAPSDDGAISRIRVSTGAAAIAHSALSCRFSAVHAMLKADHVLQRAWESAMGFDPCDRRRLGRAFLALALRAVPDGCVLFSSTDPDTIAANAGLESGEYERVGEALSRLLAAHPDGGGIGATRLIGTEGETDAA